MERRETVKWLAGLVFVLGLLVAAPGVAEDFDPLAPPTPTPTASTPATPNQLQIIPASSDTPVFRILFFDGFEDERIGSLPSNWAVKYSGNTLQVVSSPVYSGSRAFMLRGNPSWVGSVTNSIILTDDFSLEAYFYLPSGGLGRETQGSIGYNAGFSVQFIKNSLDTFEIKFAGRDQRYGTYACDTWHKIELRVDIDSNRYQALLDDRVIDTVNAHNLDSRGIQLWSSNLNDTGAQRTIYFDDITVREGEYYY